MDGFFSLDIVVYFKDPWFCCLLVPTTGDVMVKSLCVHCIIVAEESILVAVVLHEAEDYAFNHTWWLI